MEKSQIFGYFFLSCLEMYIYLCVGFYAFLMKIETRPNFGIFTYFIFFYLTPFNGTLNGAHSGETFALNVFWIFVVNLLIEISLMYAISYLLIFLFKLDQRLVHCFCMMCSIPALGEFPMIIADNFCMMSHQPDYGHCSNLMSHLQGGYALGYLAVYVFGSLVVNIDKNTTGRVSEKLKRIWHRFMFTTGKGDLAVKEFIKRFVKCQKEGEILFLAFCEKSKKYNKILMKEEGEIINTNDNIEEINKNKKKIKNKKILFGEEIEEGNSKDKQSKSETRKKKKDYYFQNIYNSDPFGRIDHNDNGNTIKENSINNNSDSSEDYVIDKEESIQKLNQINNKKNKPNINLKFQMKSSNNLFSDIKIKNISLSTVNQIFLNYYTTAFNLIESSSSFKLHKRSVYQKKKLKIIKNLSKSPPVLPIVENFSLPENDYIKLRNQFSTFRHKNIVRNIIKEKQLPVNWYLFIRKACLPPPFAVYLGMLIGVSQLRTILYSDNQYIQNIVDGMHVANKVFLPFAFTLIGIFTSASHGIYRNSSLSIKHIILICICRYIITPLGGLLAMYGWKMYDIPEMKNAAFRGCLFFPWCLPSTYNLVVMLRTNGFFVNEYGFVIRIEIILDSFMIPILYLIYFMSVGNYEY